MAASSPSPSPPPVRAGEVFRAFLALGSTAFGGPIAHIGYLRRAFVLRRRWLWPMWKVVLLLAPLLLLECVFFFANAIKIVEGAWVPLAVAGALVAIMLVTVTLYLRATRGGGGRRDVSLM